MKYNAQILEDLNLLNRQPLMCERWAHSLVRCKHHQWHLGLSNIDCESTGVAKLSYYIKLCLQTLW